MKPQDKKALDALYVVYDADANGLMRYQSAVSNCGGDITLYGGKDLSHIILKVGDLPQSIREEIYKQESEWL